VRNAKPDEVFSRVRSRIIPEKFPEKIFSFEKNFKKFSGNAKLILKKFGKTIFRKFRQKNFPAPALIRYPEKRQHWSDRKRGYFPALSVVAPLPNTPHPPTPNPGPVRARIGLPGRSFPALPAKNSILVHTFLKYAISSRFRANGAFWCHLKNANRRVWRTDPSPDRPLLPENEKNPCFGTLF